MKYNFITVLFFILPLLGCSFSSSHKLAATDGGDNDTQQKDTVSDLDTSESLDVDDQAGTDTDTDADTVDLSEPIEMDCTDCIGVGSSVLNLVCAFDICDQSVVNEASYKTLSTLVNCELEDTYEAVSHFGDDSNDLSPLLNDSYALMGTGHVVGMQHNVDCDGSLGNVGDDFSVDNNTSIHDVMKWRLTLTAPETAVGFRFKYVFFSEEYDEFIGDKYNDKFYVILESSKTNGGAPTIINYTQCRQPDEYWDFICQDGDVGCEVGDKYCYVAINTALSDCCWYKDCPDGTAWEVGTNIDGTGFSCSKTAWDNETYGSSTGWLQTSWPIIEGETFAITFHIHDTHDGILDSAVILDAFEFLGVEPSPVTIPID